MSIEPSHEIKDQTFRDSLSTITKKGTRSWIFPRKQSGRFMNYRNWAAYILLIFLFIWPFVKINGHPVFLFNVIERKFIWFGVPFWPQDFFLFGFAMITFMVFIIAFTSVFGRVWCGWACPQTIFMEFIFRRIEYWIEGDAQQQRLLANAPWDLRKLFIKAFKQSIFYFISFIIANLFLAYIIGIDELYKIITDPISEHFVGFSAIIVFSGVFFFVFAWMREQVCLVVCPYGRLQGVLLDKDSTVVAYDNVRGEPRGKLSSNTPGQGDCIDCKLCVHVCPTGIDIRNGTQMECINCTACIDACDSIMDKIHKPHGLVRFASSNSIINRTPFRFNTRMWAYLFAFTILFTILSVLIIRRPDVEATILRAPGMLYQQQSDGRISNLYTINLVNKTFDDREVELRLNDPNTEIKVIGNGLRIKSGEAIDGAFLVYIRGDDLKKNKTQIEVDVYSEGKKVDEVSTSFIGPVFHHEKEHKDEHHED